MSEGTGIEWTHTTWNPVRGCSLVSAGCRTCYAMRQAHRFSGPGGAYEGLTKQTPAGPQWTGKVSLVPEALDAPLRWRKPRRVFVNSMSDLFHDAVPDEFIDRVFAVMALAPRHTFQVLTKRPQRMRDYCASDATLGRFTRRMAAANAPVRYDHADDGLAGLQLPNVWLGVSCENQEAADERIPLLLQTPAAVRFLSCEPLLGAIDIPNGWLGEFDGQGGIDWVIAGGESGPGARPCEVAWIRSLVEQCNAGGVACFVKQLGAKPIARDRWDMSDESFQDADAAGWDEAHGAIVLRLRDRKGGDPAEWADELRVREFPRENDFSGRGRGQGEQ